MEASARGAATRLDHAALADHYPRLWALFGDRSPE